MTRQTVDYSDDYASADEPRSTIGQSFPIYKEMGAITLGTHGDNPVVAMAKAISGDTESGGSYIMKLGEYMTVTISVEVRES